MLADRYDLPVSTTSAAAHDAYLRGCDLALTLYPGAAEAFDRAIAADPGFALAHAGKAQVLLREGNAVAARQALAAARDVANGASAREASHIAFFDLAARFGPWCTISKEHLLTLSWSPNIFGGSG